MKLAFEKKLTLEQIRDSDNIAKLLSDKDIEKIGTEVVRTFDIDEQSRKKWKKNNESAMELALQIKEEKTSPWRGAANVKFPLLTIASMQFAARAYPALIKAPDLVKYRVQGSDEDGQKAARAQRISAHMSYQLLDQDESWEEDQDKALLILPILGCIFKKSYYDPIKGHNRSTLVLPKNLVVHYYAKSIEDAERKTEIFELYKRGIKERELRGVFKEHDYGSAPIAADREEDKRQGLSAPLSDKDTPRVFLEQHCYLDLDGDGYNEPYVVTVDKETRKVARIVSRIDEVITEQSIKIEELQKRTKALAEGVQQPQGQEPTPEELAQLQQTEQILIGMQDEIKRLTTEKPKVLSITAVEYYTKYGFIPSPDGGFYDIGFGLLLGSLGHTVNTLINQLIDAGSRANSSSGFLGKGARIKGGRLSFAIGEWKRVNVAGSTLRDSIVPLPASEPSQVLLSLLSLLINYTEKVGSVNDAMMGENPGQNTPAYTSKQMLEQGLQVFNGIFKRVYRSFRAETRKLYKLNSLYLDPEEYFSYQDSDERVLKTDYTGDAKDLIPAADPNAFSNTEKQMKAQAIAERSAQVPGYDPIIVERTLLESMDIPNANEAYPLIPGTNPETGEETGEMVLKFPPQPDPSLEIEKADMQRRTLEGQARAEKDGILAQSKVNVDEAQIIKLMADAAVAADKPTLERLKLLIDDQGALRQSLVELEKIEASKHKAANGVD